MSDPDTAGKGRDDPVPKRTEKKYQGKYYRKRVRRPDGGYTDVYGKTLDERDEKVDALLRDLAAAADGRQPDIYFYEYAADWYRRKSPHMSEDWKSNTRRYINKVICPVIGQMPIGDVTSDDLAEIMAGVADKSKSYQKSLVGVLKQIFDAALEADVIQKSPARTLKAGGKPPEKKDALTAAQQQTLLDAVAGQKIELFIRLALFTGMRREEILGLCWDCVVLDGAAPHINVRRTCRWEDNARPTVRAVLKSDAAWRTIPLPDVLIGSLKAERAKLTEEEKKNARLPVLHREDGSHLTYSAFRSQWNAVTVRSTESGRALGEKVKNHKYSVTIDFHVRPHILRHTYVTRLVMANVPLKRVQYLAGHADPEITLKVYADLLEHAPEDLIDDVRGAFDGA